MTFSSTCHAKITPTSLRPFSSPQQILYAISIPFLQDIDMFFLHGQIIESHLMLEKRYKDVVHWNVNSYHMLISKISSIKINYKIMHKRSKQAID